MTDRELLEAAAKAAGLNTHRWTGNGMSLPIHPEREVTGSIGRGWNPLTDDGDALRLAVRLNLIGKHSFEDALREENDACGGDYYAATRRAIVRAAASIGGAK